MRNLSPLVKSRLIVYASLLAVVSVPLLSSCTKPPPIPSGANRCSLNAAGLEQYAHILALTYNGRDIDKGKLPADSPRLILPAVARDGFGVFEETDDIFWFELTMGRLVILCESQNLRLRHD